MKNTARKKKPKEAAPAQLTLADVIRADLHEFVIDAGTAALSVLLERERTRLVGPRYAHLPMRDAYRAGSAPGELVLGGRRVSVRRPRARTRDGREVELPSWAAYAAEDPLRERAVEQMLVGVSTRSYARSLERVPDDLATRGTSRSAVSRRFVAATEQQMAEWLGRDLSAIDLVVLMIDGVYVGDDHVLLVALGFDAHGNKHVLGIREGATENAASCTALLADMRERGLRTDRAILAVIDGSKALAKSIRDVFGSRALIQRCQAHKSRNVTDQLPEELRPSVRQALRDAYACEDAARAKRLLTNLVRRLRDEHPGAAASLEEGLDETLTVKRLGIPSRLERRLSTTNAIENVIGSLRRIAARVKRWRDGRMILRWTVAAIADAATRFRRMIGAREGMTALVRALERHEPTKAPVESTKRVA
ncbi:MAG: IS256 family transposase [Candidatus Eremiobacteraeota bacterium]|nr:IS256 family transposase [Candidatus Eremiobacteraeota bacterium]